MADVAPSADADFDVQKSGGKVRFKGAMPVAVLLTVLSALLGVAGTTAKTVWNEKTSLETGINANTTQLQDHSRAIGDLKDQLTVTMSRVNQDHDATEVMRGQMDYVYRAMGGPAMRGGTTQP